jgi:hypothetical protein
MAIILGKDVTITGLSNARSVTVTNSATEIEVTKFGDTSRKYVKASFEQNVEVECVDDPGKGVGDTFTLGGTTTGNITYIVTNVSRSEPIDGIITFNVSALRADGQV